VPERTPAPAADLRRLALRRALEARAEKLRVVAENLLGAETRIDLLCVGAEGETLLVLLGEPGCDLELVARGLAQRAWVEARLPDWLQLAPQLGARPAAGVAALLLCPSFGPEAQAAARCVAADQLDLATCHFASEGAELRAFITPLAGKATRPGAALRGEPVSPFRTGLSDADLGVSPEERSALEHPPRDRQVGSAFHSD
jgi:hypothetical protein